MFLFHLYNGGISVKINGTYAEERLVVRRIKKSSQTNEFFLSVYTKNIVISPEKTTKLFRVANNFRGYRVVLC